MRIKYRIGISCIILILLLGANLVTVHSDIQGTKPIALSNMQKIAVKENGAMEKRGQKIVIYDDVVIENSFINGSIVIEGDAEVFFDNVTIVLRMFYRPSQKYHDDFVGSIEIHDSATVMIRNSKFIVQTYGPYGICLYDYSHLSIIGCKNDNLSYPVSIQSYDYSMVEIRESTGLYEVDAYDDSCVEVSEIPSGGTIDVDLYNSSNGDMFGKINGSTSWGLYDYSFLYMSFADAGSSGVDLYNYSTLTMIRSNIYGVYANQYSGIDLFDSYVFAMNAYDYASLDFENSTVDFLYICDRVSMYVNQGTISYLQLDWYEHTKEYVAPGPRAEIDDSDIMYISTTSAEMLIIRNSNVDDLYYVNVFNRTYAVIMENSIASDGYYVNYKAINTTIGALHNMTGYKIVAIGLDTLVINRSVDEIFAYNVANISIYNISSGAYIYSWHSGLHICNNMAIDGMNLYAYNSSIEIKNVNISSYPSLMLSKCNIHIEDTLMEEPYFDITESIFNITNSFIMDYASMYTYNSTGYIMNTLLNETYMSTDWSSIYLKNVYIDHINSMGSVIAVDNATIGEVDYDVRLENGEFEMERGIIVHNTSEVSSGIYAVGTYNITNISLFNIWLMNASLNITSFNDSNMNNSLGINAYFSRLEMHNTILWQSPVGLLVMAYNNSQLYIYDSNITRITCWDGYLYLESTNVTGYPYPYESNIEVDNSIVEISKSRIRELLLYDGNLTANMTIFEDIEVISGSVELNNCTVSEEFECGNLFSAMINGTLYNCDITILNNSNISGFYSFAGGYVYIENSKLGQIMSAFQHIDVVDSTVQFILNTTLFTQGTVEIRNNNIITGTGTTLINLANTVCGGYMNGISVLQNASGNPVNITIKSSAYLSFIAIGGYIYIDNSQFMVSFISTDNSVTIKDTIINTTQLDPDGPPIMILSNELVLDNATLLSEIFYAVGRSRFNIINSIINVTNFMIFNSTTFINNTDIHALNLSFYSMILDSYLEMHNSFIEQLIICNTTAIITDTKVNGTLLISNGSSINAVNMDVEKLIGCTSYRIFTFYIISTDDYFSTDIYIDMANSTIHEEYLKIYQVEFPEAEFDNETASGTYTMKTNYPGTITTGASPIIVFDISKYGRATITNYTGPNIIRGLVLRSEVDTNNPIVNRLNTTPVEYEYGVDAKLCYQLYDESPTMYEVRLNGSYIAGGKYQNGSKLCITISNYITSPGTYNVSIIAYDSDGNVGGSYTIVKVHPQEPPKIMLSPKSGYNISVGEKLILNWTAEDMSPDIYKIYKDGSLVDSNIWTSGQKISYQFQENTTGTYNITIIFYDKTGLSSSHTVIINVQAITTTTTTTTTKRIPTNLLVVGLIAIAIIIIAIVLLKRKRP